MLKAISNALLSVLAIGLSGALAGCSGSSISNYTKPEGELNTANANKPGPSPTPGGASACAADLEKTLPSYPGYRSVFKTFPDLKVLATISDIPGALAVLKSIASPTVDYHRELQRVLAYVSAIDQAHLQMLIDAAYFSAADVDRIQQVLSETESNFDEQTCLRRAAAQRDLKRINEFASQINETINVGLLRLDTKDHQVGLKLLQAVIPVEDASAAFITSYERGDGLRKAPALLEYLELAKKKDAFQAAGRFSAWWFRDFSDRSYATLKVLLDGVKAKSYDVLLKEALVSGPRELTLDEAKVLIRLAQTDVVTVSMPILGKVRPVAPATTIDILIDLSLAMAVQFRADFIAEAVQSFGGVASTDLIRLINAVGVKPDDIARTSGPYLKSPTVADVRSIADLLTPAGKTDFIGAVVGPLRLSTTDLVLEVLQIAPALPSGSILSSLLRTLREASPESTYQVAKLLPANERLRWYTTCASKMTQIALTDVALFISTMGPSERADFAIAATSKIVGVNVASILAVANLLPVDRRDIWIGRAAVAMPLFSASDVATLINLGTIGDAARLRSWMAKISGFNAAVAVEIGTRLAGAGRDFWYGEVTVVLASFTVSDTIEIMIDSYLKPVSLATKLVKKTSNLTVDSAVQITKLLSRADRDGFLTANCSLITDLSADNIGKLIQEANDQREVARVCTPRLPSLADVP